MRNDERMVVRSWNLVELLLFVINYCVQKSYTTKRPKVKIERLVYRYLSVHSCRALYFENKGRRGWNYVYIVLRGEALFARPGDLVKARSPLFYPVENLVENPVFACLWPAHDELATFRVADHLLQSRHVETEAAVCDQVGWFVWVFDQRDQWTVETTGLGQVRSCFWPVCDPSATRARKSATRPCKAQKQNALKLLNEWPQDLQTCRKSCPEKCHVPTENLQS